MEMSMGPTLSEKKVQKELTNFTSCTGLKNGRIIISPGIRSGVSMRLERQQ